MCVCLEHLEHYVRNMPWTDSYLFEEPTERVQDVDLAELRLEELEHEVAPGHPLHARKWNVIARALPQDEVLIACDDDVAFVHLTWSGNQEAPPMADSEIRRNIERCLSRSSRTGTERRTAGYS